jgi:hypothetical protein
LDTARSAVPAQAGGAASRAEEEYRAILRLLNLTPSMVQHYTPGPLVEPSMSHDEILQRLGLPRGAIDGLRPFLTAEDQ